jgi:probable HAF family extracellular repeat protein
MKSLLLSTTALAACSLFGAVPAQAQYNFTNLTAPGLPAGDYVSSVDAVSANGTAVIATSPVASPNTVDGYYLYNVNSQSLTALPLNAPGAVPGTTFYNDVNDSGQLVGGYQTAGGGSAYFLLSAGVFTNEPGPVSGFTEANGINNAGQIVGVFEVASSHEQGYLLSGGTYTTVDEGPTATTTTYPQAINNSGQIVGIYAPLAGQPADAFEDTGGTFTTFALGSTFTVPFGINDSGGITGSYSDDPNEIINNGFVDIAGVLSTIDAPGAASTDPYGIDDAGQIVGTYTDSNGDTYGFLATPAAVPEPPTWLILLAGFVGLGIVRRFAAISNPINATRI